MIEERVESERQRLRALLFDCNISEKRRDALEPIIENAAWMRAKLDDAREAIKESNVCIPYDNGGGQKGIRENPLFKGYESLWKSYMAGMCKILEYMPPKVAKAEEKKDESPKTVLELVRSKRA